MAKRGPKPKIWNKEQQRQFEALCKFQCTQAEVCVVLNMDKRTLIKNIEASYPDMPSWDEAYEYFSAGGKSALRRKQFELAMEGDKTMLIFLGKNYLGQSDYGMQDNQNKQSEQTNEANAKKQAAILKIGAKYGQAAV